MRPAPRTRPAPDRRRPSSASLLLAASVVGATVLAVVMVRSEPLGPLALIASFALAFLVAQALRLEVRGGASFRSIGLEHAIAVPALLTLRPSTAMVALLVSVPTWQLVERPPLRRAAFDVARLVVAFGAAQLVMITVLGATPRVSHASVAAVVIAVAVMLLVDQFLLAAHRALETGERLLPILGSDLWAILAFWMGSVSLGLLIAPSVRTTPDVLPAALILLVLLYAAAQAYLRAGHGDRAITGLVESAADLGADEPIAAMLRRIAEVARGIVHGCGARIELDLVELSAAAGEPLDPGEFATTIEVGSVGTVAASAVIEVDGHRLGELRAYVDPLAPSPSGGARRSERAALGILARQGAVSIVRSLAERRSRQHLEMIAQVFEHAHEGLVQLDRSGRVTACNPAAAQLLGRTCGGVTGTPVTSISAELGEAIAREVTGVHAIALVRPDGSAVTVDASIAAVRDSTIEQPVRSWVIALRDVTQAHETERLKSDFVATVSHELRTPLTTIRGFLETLLRDDVTVERDQVRSFLQIMRGESLRLERLINDLLDTSAIEAGRPPSIRTCTVDLVGEARRAAATFRAAHPGADLRFDDRVEAAGACRALADPDRMQQVLGNLLTNAARHGGGAPIELHVLPPEGGQPGLLVRDHGPGIPEREQARVFDRFYFTADSVTRRGGGAGLGLYICRRLTEAMGGTIAVDSRKGEGAAFVVRLPPATASSSGQGPGWDSVDRRRASSMACRAASTTRRVSASSTGSGAG